MRKLATLAVFAAIVIAAPIVSGTEEQGARPNPAQIEKPAASSQERQPTRARMEELARCKEEARGRQGPERARFMTDCLGSDRHEK